MFGRFPFPPVNDSFNLNGRSVCDLLFFSVTICPETKTRKSSFSYTEIYNRIAIAAFNGTDNDLTAEE